MNFGWLFYRAITEYITVQLLNIAVQLENNCTATNGKIYTGYAINQGNEPVSQQAKGETAFQPEDTIQVGACLVLEKVQKQLSNEAVRHITRGMVMYKPMDTAISNIHSSSCKPKSWELNYPALAFLLNGGYYASIMGTMGLPVIHHTTWDNLVSWVGTHVEQLAEWSCDQVRADIVKRGDKDQWTVSFDGLYLTRGHQSNNSSATLHELNS